MKHLLGLLLTLVGPAHAAPQPELQLRSPQQGVLCVDTRITQNGQASQWSTLTPDGIIIEELQRIEQAGHLRATGLSTVLAAIGVGAGVIAEDRQEILGHLGSFDHRIRRFTDDSRYAYFIENDPESMARIKENLIRAELGKPMPAGSERIHRHRAKDTWERRAMDEAGRLKRPKTPAPLALRLPMGTPSFELQGKFKIEEPYNGSFSMHNNTLKFEAYRRYVEESLLRQKLKLPNDIHNPSHVYDEIKNRLARQRNFYASSAAAGLVSAAWIFTDSLRNRRALDSILAHELNTTAGPAPLAPSSKTVTVHRIQQKKIQDFLREHADTLAGPIEGLCDDR